MMISSNAWSGLEVRHLVALEAVIAAGSFGLAARRLGYSQPAISLQIAQLERLAGTRLIERSAGRGPLGATPAGERVLRHARALLDQLRATEADLAALAAGEAGTVTVGTFQSAGAGLLPPALALLRASHPRVEVRLHEAPHDAALEHLARGETDLALVLEPVTGPFGSRSLRRDPFVHICAAGSPGAGRLPSLERLARRPLISWQRGPLTVEAAIRARGLDPLVVLRSDDRATVQELVAAGLGDAVLPRLALTLPDPRIVTADATRHLPPRGIAVAWHRDRELSPAARALLDCLRPPPAA